MKSIELRTGPIGRGLMLTLFAVVAAWPFIAKADAPKSEPAKTELLVGRDYEVVNPTQLTNDASKIEVREFFSYGCSHCFAWYPIISKWEHSAARDVDFVRSAISVGHQQWEPLARAFYAFEYSGDLKRLDTLIFQAIHERNVNLYSDDNLVDWAAQNGLDKLKVRGMLSSMAVVSKSRQAEADARTIPVSGTPTVIVDGKYRLVGSGAKSLDELPALIDALIAKARADRAAAHKK